MILACSVIEVKFGASILIFFFIQNIVLKAKEEGKQLVIDAVCYKYYFTTTLKLMFLGMWVLLSQI